MDTISRRHFQVDFLEWNVWILIKISLKFVSKGLINNNPALVQIMAWRRPGAKPLSEPMMVSLLTHICVTRPQWVNSLWANAYVHNKVLDNTRNVQFATSSPHDLTKTYLQGLGLGARCIDNTLSDGLISCKHWKPSLHDDFIDTRFSVTVLITSVLGLTRSGIRPRRWSPPGRSRGHMADDMCTVLSGRRWAPYPTPRSTVPPGMYNPVRTRHTWTDFRPGRSSGRRQRHSLSRTDLGWNTRTRATLQHSK